MHLHTHLWHVTSGSSSVQIIIQMTHRLEWISAEWMHELTLEQFKPTSAANGF